MVGELPDPAYAVGLGFAREGDAIALAGRHAPSLLASELARLRGEPVPDTLPETDVDELLRTLAAVREAVRSGVAASAHDIAEGGLAVALAECCLAGGLGAEVTLASYPTALFGEGPGAFLLSGEEAALRALPCEVEVIGRVAGDSVRVRSGGHSLAVGLADLRAAHESGLARYLG
jgi:phosphoribosylformylglycinamidine synthase